DWGDTFDTIVAAARGAGFPLRGLPCVAGRVDPEAHLALEWEAFAQLSTDRPVGLSRGAIPWSSIDGYAARFSIAGDESGRFARLIRAMDEAYLAYFRDKQPDAQP